MNTRYRRRALSELIATGDRWLSAVLVMVFWLATYGLVEKFL